jgi:hypothetical protein
MIGFPDAYECVISPSMCFFFMIHLEQLSFKVITTHVQNAHH